VFGKQGQQAVEGEVGDGDGDEAAGKGEEEVFDPELAEDLRAGCSEGEAGCEFRGAA